MVIRPQVQNQLLRLGEVDVDVDAQSRETIEHHVATAVLAARGFADTLARMADDLEVASQDYLFSGFGEFGDEELKYIKNLADEYLTVIGRN